ncbi:MAG: hypothetical protein ABI199_07035 [Bacteroidia bacterium]
MKKNITMGLLLFCFGFNFVSAQFSTTAPSVSNTAYTSKGNFILGTDLASGTPYGNATYKEYENNALLTSGSTSHTGTAFNFNLQAAYFVANSWCIGLRIFPYPQTFDYNPPSLNPYLGIFTRYYFGQKKHPFSYTNQNKVAFYMEEMLVAGYGSEKEVYNSNYYNNSYNFNNNYNNFNSNPWTNSNYLDLGTNTRLACTFLICKHVALSGILSYSYNYLTTQTTTTTINIASNQIERDKTTDNSFSFIANLEIYL